MGLNEAARSSGSSIMEHIFARKVPRANEIVPQPSESVCA